MLPPQYMASLPAAAFYGLQQPAAAMYSAAYGNAGLEDLAALQRQAGLHTLVGSTATGATALAQAQALASGNSTVHHPTVGGAVKGVWIAVSINNHFLIFLKLSFNLPFLSLNLPSSQ